MRRSVDVGWEMAHLVEPAPVVLRLALRPSRRILAWPDVPSRYQVLFKLCALNGFRIVTDPKEPHDVAFHFEYRVQPCRLPSDKPTVNRDCGDVSKRRVAEVFEKVFGYALAVAPQIHDGAMVEKPNGNYTFEGRILHGPLRQEHIDPDRVYERFIDTVVAGEAVDLRTPVYGQEIPIVYAKRRPQSGGLKDHTSAKICDPEDVYSPSERDGLLMFARELGLDYGELDVLRDRKDGRIYVVDVNNTPAGPPQQMSDAEIATALRMISPSFERLLDFVAERDSARPAAHPGKAARVPSE